jgi:(S)-citramalyl-CoA lyase
MSNNAAWGLHSWLFVPATRPDRIAKAMASGADAVIIDLEDAVSLADKQRARANAFAATEPRMGAKRALRVNGLGCHEGLADISAVLNSELHFDFLVLPKVEYERDVLLVDEWLTAGRFDTQLIALIETAHGLEAVCAIARSTQRLAALLFGAADMAADLSSRPTWEPMLFARSRIVAACAGAGIPAIDSPFFGIADDTALREEASRSAALGFHAKAAIHPAQLPGIKSAFTPSEAELEEARRTLVENEKGAASLDGKMVDEAVARRARRILRLFIPTALEVDP